MTLSRKQGDTWVLEGVRTDESGDPVSLQGVTILAQLRSGSGVLTFSPAIGNAAAGEFTLTALPADTAALPARSYNFDVQYTDASGAVESTETAQFIVTPDNSRL